ncbi:hypothetical protein X740_00725 [Mesorhizobium sp. LNHC221B00]|nr:hypothetical protein X740_00725 [Mesorhizobium sp. LNHC221B00]
MVAGATPQTRELAGGTVAFLPQSKVRTPGVLGRWRMRYNWERAPTTFERHRKAMAAAILIFGGVGLMLVALPI